MTAAPAIGPRLKAERERRGLSSQKAADELHLDGWVIEALEAENYERIGPEVYAKGHLKRYATLLGLPAEEIMTGYESRAQAPPVPPTQALNVRVLAEAPEVSNLPWQRVAGMAAVLVLAIGVLWWKPWHRHSAAPAAREITAENPGATSAGPATDSAEAVVVAGAPPAAMAAPLQRSASALMPTSLTSSAAAAPSAPEGDAIAGTGRARLRLSFSADSWVDVHDAAGRRVFAGNGRANSMKTIAGIAPLRVYLGFASGVQLEINDRAVAIGSQFLAGDVARFEAGADGVLRRDSRSATAAGAPTRTARPSD